MSALILDGKKIRDERLPDLAKRFSSFSRQPVLAIIQVGDRPDSDSYIKAKKTFAEKVGVKVCDIRLPENISQNDLIQEILKQNEDNEIDGVIVQLPLPDHLDQYTVIDSISPLKDVDALTAFNVKRWLAGVEGSIIPATARGIKTLFQYYNINIVGKKIVVIGRSLLVGKPIVSMCLKENATVTVCHSKTSDLKEETLSADIVIIATGKVGLLQAEHVKTDHIIIDVGINSMQGSKFDDEVLKRKLVGDVNFEAVFPIVSAISPVPGGIGPLTVISLFENLYDLLNLK